MVQYEWVWLDEHLQGLRLGQLHPERMSNLGGAGHVYILISECVLFQLILRQELSQRNLIPLRTHAPMVPSEEAWESTSVQVKQECGIVPA